MTTSLPADTFMSQLGVLPDSPLGVPGLVEGFHRNPSNDDGKPKTVWVHVPAHLTLEKFDPRSQAWAFQVSPWMFRKK
jgi:hypothetical protein